MSGARLAALEAVAEAARKWRQTCLEIGATAEAAHRVGDALDALPPLPPAGATERVRPKVVQMQVQSGDENTHANARYLLDNGEVWMQLFHNGEWVREDLPPPCRADIPTEPPPVPDVAATVEKSP